MQTGNHLHPDFHLLFESLEKCHRKDGSIKTDQYLCVFGELNRLFHCMGKGLGLSMHSVPQAIKALEILRVRGSGCHYDNLTLMLEYEAENQLQKGSSKVMSGTAAVLRLHQSLSFILAFLKELLLAVERDKPFQAANRVKLYAEQLAHFHPIWIRSSVKVLLRRSPGRKEWLEKMSHHCHGGTDPIQVLTMIVEKGTKISEATSELFRNHALRAP